MPRIVNTPPEKICFCYYCKSSIAYTQRDLIDYVVKILRTLPEAEEETSRTCYQIFCPNCRKSIEDIDGDFEEENRIRQSQIVKNNSGQLEDSENIDIEYCLDF